MPDPRDIVDIPGVTTGRDSPRTPEQSSGANAPGSKSWLGIWFRCCHTYGRLYKDPTCRTYVGRCPKCGAQARAKVGSGGTNRRLFEAH